MFIIFVGDVVNEWSYMGDLLLDVIVVWRLGKNLNVLFMLMKIGFFLEVFVSLYRRRFDMELIFFIDIILSLIFCKVFIYCWFVRKYFCFCLFGVKLFFLKIVCVVFRLVVILCSRIKFCGLRVDLMFFNVLERFDVIWIRFEVMIRLFLFIVIGGCLEIF